MTHKEKKHLARRHMNRVELKFKGLPWFKTRFWEKRKVQIKIKVAKREKPELAAKLGL